MSMTIEKTHGTYKGQTAVLSWSESDFETAYLSLEDGTSRVATGEDTEAFEGTVRFVEFWGGGRLWDLEVSRTVKGMDDWHPVGLPQALDLVAEYYNLGALLGRFFKEHKEEIESGYEAWKAATEKARQRWDAYLAERARREAEAEDN